ncbi:MAG: hypothetical protein KBD64_03595 [Gammaproteobacteria bacterium]|nr:hypothetical protein [Gammaproteobacteria bacterium]
MENNYRSLLALLVASAVGFNVQTYAETFKTNISNTNYTDTKVFKVTSNQSHKMVFYNGKAEGQPVSGYYKSAHFLGWTNNKFQPLENVVNPSKGILSTVDGPYNHTIVLSYIDGSGQLLSSSADGTNWGTTQVIAPSNYFTKLASTNAFGFNQVIAYGKSHFVFFVTNDGRAWYQTTMPNGCSNAQNCAMDNKYFGDVGNYFTVVQTATVDNVKNNILYLTRNLQNWYYKNNLPFANHEIQKVFKGDFNTLSVVAIDSKGDQRLWLTPDLENWVAFDLPKNVKVTDLLVRSKNRLDLLLVKNTTVEEDSTTTTDLVSIDPETKALTTVKTFSGVADHMRVLDDKLYLTGNFVNVDDDNVAILASSSL